MTDDDRRRRDHDAFVAAWPDWATTRRLDELRASDFARLDDEGHVYLDFTGGGLHATSQLERHHDLLADEVLGNPHSGNPASTRMTALVEQARERVLRFFGVSSDQYAVVFTPNASGALKLVGESFPFRPGGCFALSADNHNSVNGVREFARRQRADTAYVPLEPTELRIDERSLVDTLEDPRWQGDKLFAFPAQSNYSGVKHPLRFVRLAQESGWDVLLDCAAYAPTSPLDLSEVAPDFATFSFYKMFGYPTGVGCLIARRDALAKLRRPWFAGGTVQIASVRADDHRLARGEAAFEDGTVNYLMAPAVTIGLDLLDDIGMDTISTRIRCLTGWLLDELQQIRHGNGRPMITIHGPKDLRDRGGTITCNLVDPDGVPFHGARIEELAGDARISIRTGCFCNPGAGETAHGLDAQQLQRFFRWPTDLGFQELAAAVRDETGIEVSSSRISVGHVTSFSDVWRMRELLASFRDRSAASVGSPVPIRSGRDAA